MSRGCADPVALLWAIPLQRGERELSAHGARADADLFHARGPATLINFTDKPPPPHSLSCVSQLQPHHTSIDETGI